jgi:sugar/nucleoside kinase (ribokinase family)
VVDKFNVVAAGHICLDVIPGMDHLPSGQFGHLFQPGQLISVGPATFSTGGPVSNTGLALFRLGVPTRLLAKVGTDPFGQLVCGLVNHIHPDLVKGMVVDAQAITSYTLIVNAPGVDRIFLHCSGANDTFGPEDIDNALVAKAGLFHFGYPPIMRRMYSQGGAELAEVLRRARAVGATTSLDMAFPDPSSPGGQVNWREILKASLPLVDIFLPSIEELLFMIDRPLYERMAGNGAHSSLLAGVQPGLLARLAGELIKLGVKVVVFKLGERGLYLRTAGRAALSQMGRAAPLDLQAWADQELWAPCYQVNVVGTTGSGDATIAGFLSALLRDFTPRQAINAAVAVGACNVEAADALSGLRSWDDTLARVRQGWARLPLEITAPGWSWCEQDQVWVGPGSSMQGGPDGDLVG